MTFDDLTFSELGIAQIRWRKTDGTYHRETREPDSRIGDLPNVEQQKCKDMWTPKRLASWQETAAALNVAPIVETPPRNILAEIDAMKARLTTLESTNVSRT